MVYLFLAEGFEETEALSIADVLKRGNAEVKLISITGCKLVKGSHDFKIESDALFEECDFKDADVCVLPGGMPGSTNLLAYTPLVELLKKQLNSGKYIAAICAAPMVFGKNGMLKGKKAICYPGMTDNLEGAIVTEKNVVKDGNIITSRGPATAMEFGLEILRAIKGDEVRNRVAQGLLFDN